MKKRIAVIGSGVAGLHLGYAFRKCDLFDVTIFTHRTAEEVRCGRVMSTQVHFSPTREREERYGMPAWEERAPITAVHVSLGGQPLFIGPLEGTALSVDQRLYFSTYMKDLQERGMTFRHERLDKAQLEALVDEYDLVIDCSGKAGPLFPFETVAELSPLTEPLRKCNVGYFRGVTRLQPAGLGMNALPGSGELFEIPVNTEQGPATIFFIEAVPGGALDVFKGVKNHEEFAAKMREVIATHFQLIEHRIDDDAYGLIDEHAYLQIALKPVIRKPYAMVNGKVVLGCGDAVALNDPITGQGCNTTSYSAEQLFLTLMEEADGEFTEETGEKYWARIQEYVKHVTGWTNAMMQPFPEHIGGLLMGAATDAEKATFIASWFNKPGNAYKAFFEREQVKA